MYPKILGARCTNVVYDLKNQFLQIRHFSKAVTLLSPYRTQPKYREGVSVIINRLAQRIEDKYGRLRPVNIEKEEYERDK